MITLQMWDQGFALSKIGLLGQTDPFGIGNYIIEASVPMINLLCVIRKDVDNLYVADISAQGPSSEPNFCIVGSIEAHSRSVVVAFNCCATAAPLERIPSSADIYVMVSYLSSLLS